MINTKQYLIVNAGFMIFGICGIGTAIVNGIPFRSLGNDGYNAITLSKRKNARIAVEKTLLVNKAMADNIRIKNMPKEWFLLDEETEDCILRALKKFDKLAEQYPYPQDIELERELIQIVKDIEKEEEEKEG